MDLNSFVVSISQCNVLVQIRACFYPVFIDSTAPIMALAEFMKFQLSMFKFHFDFHILRSLILVLYLAPQVFLKGVWIASFFITHSTIILQDKNIKGTVFRVTGSIPAGNYIQLPKTTSQSLGLTGRYFYLMFRPIPSKYFVVHLDIATQDNLVVRISFSNLFKEFKSTSTWLQFPFVTSPFGGSVHSSFGSSCRGEYCRTLTQDDRALSSLRDLLLS